MSRLLAGAGKTVALWFAMVFGTALSGAFVHFLPRPFPPDGPMPAGVALLLVNAAGAVVIAALASRLDLPRFTKAAALFVVIFAAETGLSSIESTVFRQTLGLSPSTLIAIAGAGAMRALVAAVAAALLWPRPSGSRPETTIPFVALASVVLLYIALYFGAGFLIAWRSEAVRAFYASGATIDLPLLVAVQVVRGSLWCALAAFLARTLRGSPVSVAIWTGAAFAVLTAAPLFYPSGIMPWAVRRVHLVELAVSNFLFGLGAVLILRGRRALIPGRRG